MAAITGEALKDLILFGQAIVDGDGYDPRNHVGIQIRDPRFAKVAMGGQVAAAGLQAGRAADDLEA